MPTANADGAGAQHEVRADDGHGLVHLRGNRRLYRANRGFDRLKQLKRDPGVHRERQHALQARRERVVVQPQLTHLVSEGDLRARA